MSEETKVKDSNELLNIILILLGAVYIFLALMEILGWFGIDLGLGWLDIPEAALVLGPQGLVTITLGIFAVIAGIGMFKEEEWALGIALVVLAFIVVNAVADLLGFINIADWWGSWINWITIITLIIAAVGFLWLIFTTERYH